MSDLVTISDSTGLSTGSTPSTAGGSTLSTGSIGSALSPLSPIHDIRSYLGSRTPAPHWTAEESLFVTLPSNIRSDLRDLLGSVTGGGAFGHVATRTRGRHAISVQAACTEAQRLYSIPGSLKRFRARYDLWARTGDWVSLVNRAKAGAVWQQREGGLPEAFLDFCASRFAQYKRADGKRQALLEIKRQWTTGRNLHGDPEPIPGYESGRASVSHAAASTGRAGVSHAAASTGRAGVSHAAANASDYPVGWSYSNILAQIKARAKFSKAVQALAHESTAAAHKHLPGVHFDRNTAGPDHTPLRFLETVEFDDVKTDFLVVDPETQQVCDLWLLVARDRATALLLGFGMRPARTREDGTQEHLRLRDMKQLIGWLLERWGLPPYTIRYKVEHGTATVSEGTARSFTDLLPGRITISFSSMLGGKSPAGYQQRATGNSRGKASLESHNRLMHTMAAGLPGQTGPLYTVRPADLAARAKESAEIMKLAQHLPAHLRGQLGYSLLTINQAREHLFRIFTLQNERTEHELQGFEEVVEVFDPTRNLWVPQSQVGHAVQVGLGVPTRPSDLRARVRKESPLERCARLVAPYASAWTRVSPEIITAFYDHTARTVPVKENGLIEITVDGRTMQFAPPPNSPPQIPGTKLLGYFHPDDPAYLHLTDGRGRIIGTWLRRNRANDDASVTQAIRYQKAALKAARLQAEALAAPERQRLDDMRARNAELLAAHTFVEVVNVEQPSLAASPLTSDTAAALCAIATERESTRAESRAAAESAADAILNSPRPEPTDDTSVDDFLSAISTQTR